MNYYNDGAFLVGPPGVVFSVGGGGVSYNVTYSYGCYGDLFE